MTRMRTFVDRIRRAEMLRARREGRALVALFRALAALHLIVVLALVGCDADPVVEPVIVEEPQQPQDPPAQEHSVPSADLAACPWVVYCAAIARCIEIPEGSGGALCMGPTGYECFDGIRDSVDCIDAIEAATCEELEAGPPAACDVVFP